MIFDFRGSERSAAVVSDVGSVGKVCFSSVLVGCVIKLSVGVLLGYRDASLCGLDISPRHQCGNCSWSELIAVRFCYSKMGYKVLLVVSHDVRRDPVSRESSQVRSV